MVTWRRFLDIDCAENRSGVILGFAYLSVTTVEILLEGILYSVLANHGVIRIVQKRITLIFFLSHEPGITQNVRSILSTVISNIGPLNFNSNQFILQNGRNKLHTGVLNKEILRCIDRITNVDGVTNASNDAHLLTGITVINTITCAHKTEKLYCAGVFRQAIRFLTNKVCIQHRALDRRHVFIIGKRRGAANRKVICIMISKAFHHTDQFQNHGVRVFVGKQLYVVDLQVVTLFITDENTTVPVQNVSPGSRDGAFRICNFIAQIVVPFTFNNLQTVQKGHVDNQDQNDQNNHKGYSARFNEMIHRKLLQSFNAA